MSRGHGIRQRQLLERLDGLGDLGQYVKPDGATPAEAVALRRAAYQLEREGLILLRVHRGRLVMYRPDASPALTEGFIVGTDGRLYRSPHGQTREDLQADQEEQRLWDEFLTRYSDLADVHGHEHGPGVLLCYDCAESAGADKTLLEKLRAAGSMPAAQSRG